MSTLHATPWFRYEAQTPTGEALEGRLRAADAETARQTLEAVQLRIMRLDVEPDERGQALRHSDFFAFNQQLAQLTEAGLTIDSGLRLIAQDMRAGLLSRSVQAVAGELERGVPLAEAFAHHRRAFPPLYSRLVDAGVRANRLPTVLLTLTQYLQRSQRLRVALWSAAAYPLVVIVCFVLVMAFIGSMIMPQFAEIFADFETDMPALTEWLLRVAPHTVTIAVVVFALLMLFPLLSLLLRFLGLRGWLRDHVAMSLPLIGPAIHRNLLSQWVSLLRVGVAAGMDLPDALGLASEAVSSDRLRHESRRLIDTLTSGQPLDTAAGLSLIPASLPASVRLAADRGNLAALLEDLALLYEQQAELRFATLRAMLPSIFTILLALVIGVTVIALFLPLVNVMQSVM